MVSLSQFLEGRVLSITHDLRYLSEIFHLLTHLRWIFVLSSCHNAEMLRGRGFLNDLGSLLLGLESPSAALLVCMSAS